MTYYYKFVTLELTNALKFDIFVFGNKLDSSNDSWLHPTNKQKGKIEVIVYTLQCVKLSYCEELMKGSTAVHFKDRSDIFS